ncbi:acyl-CoA dehydrogenase family protein [Massilia sp. LXY-6]|uniref:acyl-CoA dehydrogenase family protein n=1 Tax=Massilia sp. LXY-6 TaxID=3379823 RepID=UPI003EDF4A29
MAVLDESLIHWLKERAEALDTHPAEGDAVLARLAQAGLFAVGVPQAEGGTGAGPAAAVRVVAGLAEHSLSAAFVFWAQRAFIECLLASPNRGLVRKLMPELLQGRLAGAPGLSNAMKFLGGLDRLRVSGSTVSGTMRLDGSVAWATNLHRQGFVVAIAAGDERGDNPSVIAVPHDAPGLQREPDLDLLALRGTNTAALRLSGVAAGEAWQLHPQARVFLPAIRPAFIGLQCGLGLGLARASLRAARHAVGGGHSMLAGDMLALEAATDDYAGALFAGLDDGRLCERPRELLQLRLRMVELAAGAVQLELQALGGRALLGAEGRAFSRRSREAAFLTVVTPTVVQLKNDLAQLAVQRPQ